MQRSFLILLFAITSFVTFSQETFLFKGHVLDLNGEKINDARIIFKNVTEVYSKNGEFNLTLKMNDYSPITIVHVAFDTLIITPKKRWFKKATKNGNYVDYFKMYEKVYATDVVVIEFNKKPTEVYGNDSIGVEDFELINDQIVFIGTTKNLKKESTLYLTDKTQKLIDIYHIDGIAEKLIRDFRKEVHLVCKEKVYHVNTENNKIQLESIDKDYFFTYVAPIIDTVEQEFFYSNYSDIYPEFKYKSFNKKDSTYTVVKSVEDKLMMELYRSEYKYVDVRTKLWAMEMEQDSGIDKEVWVGANYFTHSLYYDELYAPMFNNEDSIFLFDHYDHYLYKYHPEDGMVDSLKIEYHKKPMRDGWKKNMVQDQKNNKIYAHFEKAGYAYLKMINTNTGQIAKNNKLFYKYVEKIRVKDDYVYYIYRPFESTQEKFIYREKIK